MTGTAYLLTLTENDVETIARADVLCFWAIAMRSLEAGDNIMTRAEARKIRDAIEQDMVYGNGSYDGLDRNSTLVEKLHNLYQSIV